MYPNRAFWYENIPFGNHGLHKKLLSSYATFWSRKQPKNIIIRGRFLRQGKKPHSANFSRNLPIWLKLREFA
jgi:hypothetical protein